MSKEYGCFVLGDSSRCTGCQACVAACFESHRNSRKGRTVGTVNSAVQARLYIAEASDKRMAIQCRHCENAPCLAVCPVGAITKENNTVILNSEVCIGCKSCISVCPFGAIETSKQNGTTVFLKCDCCAGKEMNACIRACPNNALRLVEPEAENKNKREQAVRAMLLP